MLPRTGCRLAQTCLGLIAAACMGASVPCLAQGTGAPPSLLKNTNGSAFDAGTCKRFDALFASIATRSKLCIVAENQPLDLRLSDSDAVALASHLRKETASVEEIVSTAAGAFDYESTKKSDHLWILRKKYRSVGDTPDVTLQETMRFLQNILTTSRDLNLYVSDDDSERAMRQLGIQLTSQVVIGGDRDKNVIAVKSLTEEQQKLAWQASQRFFLAKQFKYIQRVVDHFRLIDNSSTRFEYFTMPDGLSISYVGNLGINGVLKAYPLEDRYLTQVGGGVLISNQPQSRSNLPKPTGVGEETVSESKYRMPLSVAISKTTGNTYTVDSTIADKHVSIFGEVHASGEEKRSCITEIYGLRVVKNDNGLMITTPAARQVRNLNALSEEVCRIIPPPLAHLCLGIANETRKKLEEEGNNKSYPPDQKEFVQANINRTAARSVPLRLYATSKTKLRGLISEKVPNEKSPPIKVRDTGPEEHKLIALMSLGSTCLSGIMEMMDLKIPKFVEDFQGASIRASVSPDGSLCTFSIGHLDENGVFRLEAGGSISSPSK